MDSTEQDQWTSRRQGMNAKRMKGPLIVGDGGSYYRAGKKRFWMTKTAVTASLRSTYSGPKPPWEFDYFVECIEC